MTANSAAGGRSRNLILAAMIFAVAMTFIDQTIVSIAAPNIQRGTGADEHRSAVGHQRLSVGSGCPLRLRWSPGRYRRAPQDGGDRGRGVRRGLGLVRAHTQGRRGPGVDHHLPGRPGSWAGPSCSRPRLGIVVQTFDLHQRGRALAMFFGIAGGLTAVGPVLGGYLTEWTWRAIFWVNIPVALIALVLIAISKPVTDYRRAPIDYRGLFLIVSGVALSIVGFQQSANWGWSNPFTILCIVVGVALLVVFALVELQTPSPLMQVRIFRIRAFAVENLVLGIAMLVFVPIFFFASEYAQIALGKSAQQAGLYLLYFFLGFVVTSQIGGRILDRRGAKRPVVIGCALAAVGFALWAGQGHPAELLRTRCGRSSWPGAGMGFMLTPASTDAVNRASRLSYGEATGITQTVRNYAASLGFAILGTILVTQLRSRVTSSLIAQGARPPAPPPRPPTSGRRRTRRQHRNHTSLHPPRLRLRDAHRLLRHGGHHGRGRHRGLHRPRSGLQAESREGREEVRDAL